MMSVVYVNADEFMAKLERRGLVIVHRDQLKHSVAVADDLFEKERAKLLKQRSVTFKQAIDYRLVPVKTKNGINSMVRSKKIAKDAVFKNRAGNMMILTSALKKLQS